MKTKFQKENHKAKRHTKTGDTQPLYGEGYYAAFDTMLEGVQVLGHDWRYIYLNTVAEKHNRRANQELLGNKYMDMWPGIEKTHVFSLIKGCLEKREPHQLDNRFVYPDGTVGWFKLSIQPVPEGVLIMSFDITEAIQAEQSLRESEERLKFALQAAHMGVWEWELETDSVYWSPGCYEIVGLDRSINPINTLADFKNIVHPDDINHVMQSVQQALKNKTVFQSEFRAVRPDKSVIWLRNYGQAEYDEEGKPLKMVGTVEDITERVQAEEKLSESEQRFRHLFVASPDAIMLIDPSDPDIDWPIVDCNEIACQMNGYTREELVGKSVNILNITQGTPEERADYLERARRDGVLRLETHHRHRDGHIFPIETSTSMITFEGRELILGIDRDITIRKQVEEALQESESRYRTLVEQIPAVTYIASLDETSTTLYISPQIEKYIGFDAEEYRTNPDIWLQQLHPEDRERMLEEVRRSHESGEPFMSEYRMLSRDGQVIWFRDEASIIRDSSGEPKFLQGLMFDITDRKHTETALVENERRFRGLINHAPDGIVIFGNSGRIEYVSPATTRIMGYSTDEALSTNPVQVTHPDDLPSLEQALAELTQTPTKTITIEYRMRHKDGSWRWLESNISNFSAVPGIEGFVFNFRDISERKSAEREIQKRTEDLLLINTLNEALNRGEDLESIIEALAQETQKVFDCLAVAVYLLSPDEKYIEMHSYTIPRALIGKIEKLIGQSIPRVRIKIRKGSLLKQILENENGMLLNDPGVIQQWIGEFSETTFLPSALRSLVKKFIPQIYKILNIGSAISIPLISSGQPIGILDMSSRSQFSEDDLQRLRNIAPQVTTVLLRKQVDKQVKLQLQRMRALSDIDRAISSSLDMRISLDVLLREVLSQLEVDAAAVLLLNQSTQMLEFVAGKGFRSPRIRQSRVRLGEGCAGQAGINRQMVHIPNLTDAGAGFTRAELLSFDEFVEYLAVPLIAKGVLKGVLEIYHRTPLNLNPEWKGYLETLSGQAAIAIDNAQLFEGMQKLNQELIMAYDATIAGWSRAMDLRDEETEGHTQRVTELTLKLAEKFEIDQQEQVQIRRGALLHDIGKLGVPDNILLKPGKLTEDEWEIMRQHPRYAYEMLMPIAYLRPALDIPYCHHEKWDGSGYPRGLKGEQIPLAARIFAVIDVWDALTSDRPYRSAWSPEKALEYIKEQSGHHFDPEVVSVFIKTIFKEIN